MSLSYIWAFDPGSKATGVAVIHPLYHKFVKVEQFEAVTDAYHFMDTQWGTGDVVLIEMYRSSGHLNRHAQATIEAVGFLSNAVRYFLGEEPALVTEQSRLSGQREAAEYIGDDIDVLRQDPERKDGFSALAHACAYRRRINERAAEARKAILEGN